MFGSQAYRSMGVMFCRVFVFTFYISITYVILPPGLSQIQQMILDCHYCIHMKVVNVPVCMLHDVRVYFNAVTPAVQSTMGHTPAILVI